MTTKQLLVSIIIPTHNRAERLPRALQALSEQVGAPPFEVIVVADGCVDDTATVVQAFSAPYALRVLEQAASGPAAARNAGAAIAEGELLIFIDDDIEVDRGFVAAHTAAHRHERAVSIGYLPPIVLQSHDYFGAGLRLAWENVFAVMRERGHRFNYTDLLSGNFSLSKALFEQVGGFNPEYWCHEDYELGLRLIAAGAELVFSPRAKGFHHEITTLNRSLRRKFDEGKADVQLAVQYPALKPYLLMTMLYRASLLPSRLFRQLAFRTPKLGDGLMYGFEKMMRLLERAGMRATWRRVQQGLMAYWYWRGVAQLIPTIDELVAFLAAFPPDDRAAAFRVDLADGVETVMAQLDAARPKSLLVCFGEHEIGYLPERIGTERLHGGHLRPLLVNKWSIPMLRALALDNKLPLVQDQENLIERCEWLIEQQKLDEALYGLT